MKVADKIIKYVKSDSEKTFGLDEAVRVQLEGVDPIPGRNGTLFIVDCVTKDGSLEVHLIQGESFTRIDLTAHPFPASAHLWNGPDLLKKTKYRSMLASLFHDLIWSHRKELSEALGITIPEVLDWGNGVLYGVWMHASGKSFAGRLEARLAWQVCDYSKGWYHQAKEMLGLNSLILALLLVVGCGTPPDWRVTEIEGTNAVLRAMGKEQRVEVVAPTTEESATEVAVVASARPWRECKYSSNWDGNNAAKRMMNLVSPKFSDSKVKEYLDWLQSVGCDHCHLLLVNEGDGEGAGYDALADASTRKTALKRVQQIRARGMGVVAWIVADDSNSYRKKIFTDPAKYAEGLKEYMPYLSYICLGLEMNEGEGSSAKWKSLRDAIKAAGWEGKFATHHTSGKSTYASLGSIVMDQLDPDCSTSEISHSVTALRAKGYEVCGFEYSRGPDKSKAQAALDAGAFSCGNWKGSAATTTTPTTTETPAAATKDEVDFGSLDFCWGSFSGGKAKLVDGVEITSLKVSGSGLSYKWAKGGCEKLGASSSTDASCLACLFCKIDGTWKGGKFDWISTSRTTRGFENITDGHNGWQKDAVSKATEYAFVIVSSDGKKRSNVITCK